MTDLTELTERVRNALGSMSDKRRSQDVGYGGGVGGGGVGGWWDASSPWETLIRLYETDREAFYLLACEGLGESADLEFESLATLAQWMRKVVRASYHLVPPSGDDGHVEIEGDSRPVPAGLFPRVRRFLLEIDGKGVTERKGKDYEGQAVSEAEVRFKLGERHEWEAQSAKQEMRRKAKPFVLRIDPEDLLHIATQPAYVTYELLHCARRTVLAPTVAFRGLKRGGDAPPKVNNGWAIFGKPRQTYGNDGTPQPAPSGMVFVVYADEDGYAFDWDWVQEDPDKPGYPLGPWQDRFNEQANPQQELVLELPEDLHPGEFDPAKVCYSNRGDCLFCYMTQAETYAVRINHDLTVFQAVGTNEHTGFKIKNVRRILEFDKSIVVSDPPVLTVALVSDPPALTLAVDSVLMAVSRRQHDEGVKLYTVLIRRLHTIDKEPKVRVPARELVGTSE